MIRLLRTRSAGDFGWSFTALNFVGLSLFAYRSWEIGEWGFLGVNVLTATFWGLVLLMKAGQRAGVVPAPEGSSAPARD